MTINSDYLSDAVVDAESNLENLKEVLKKYPNARKGTRGWIADGAGKHANAVEAVDGGIYAFEKIGQERVYDSHCSGDFVPFVFEKIQAEAPEVFSTLIAFICKDRERIKTAYGVTQQKGAEDAERWHSEGTVPEDDVLELRRMATMLRASADMYGASTWRGRNEGAVNYEVMCKHADADLLERAANAIVALKASNPSNG